MEGINGTVHPLQTPIILEQIFGNLGFYDLKACRRVCKEWRSSSSKFFCPLTKVVIDEREKRRWTLPNRSLSKFFDDLLIGDNTTSKLPFSNSFRFVRFGAIDPKFWSHYGQQIHSLELCNVQFHSGDSFRTVIFQGCTNLKKLLFNHVYVDGDRPNVPCEWVEPQSPPNFNLKSFRCENLCHFGIGAMELICHFPSLENLDIVTIKNTAFSGELLKSLMIARRHDKACWNISNLSFDLTCVKERPDLISFLTDGIPQLNTLGLNFQEAEAETIEIGRRILNAHSTSLKQLDIRSRCFFPRITNLFSLPNNGTFENLQELKLDTPLLSSITFPFNVPNLKILALSVHQFSLSDIPANLVFPSCTQLLLYNNSPMLAYNLRKLGGWLPNLEKLRIEYLDDKMFEVVCRLWPNLRHLEILKGIVSDLGISGFDSEDVTKMNREGGPWRPITVPRAGLSSLKFLETLRLERMQDIYFPGYCSVTYGFLPLAHLRHLFIQNSDNGWWFKEYKTKIWKTLLPRLSFNSQVLLPELSKLFNDFN